MPLAYIIYIPSAAAIDTSKSNFFSYSFSSFPSPPLPPPTSLPPLSYYYKPRRRYISSFRNPTGTVDGSGAAVCR